MSNFLIGEKLTLNEMSAKYSGKWLGLAEVVWSNDAISSAVVKYKNKTPKELKELLNDGKIDVSVLVMPEGMCVVGRNDN